MTAPKPGSVEALYGDVMRQTPADRLRLAAGIIESGRADLVPLALDIIRITAEEVSLRHLGTILARTKGARP